MADPAPPDLTATQPTFGWLPDIAAALARAREIVNASPPGLGKLFLQGMIGHNPENLDKLAYGERLFTKGAGETATINPESLDLLNAAAPLAAAVKGVVTKAVSMPVSSLAQGQAGMILGPRATLFNPKTAKAAQVLEDLGRSPQDVYAATGNWKTPADNAWRQEISDQKADFRPRALETLRRPETPQGFVGHLGDMFYHPELYAAYPDLAKVEVVLDNSLEGMGMATHSQQDPSKYQIHLNPQAMMGWGAGQDEFRRTTLHEIGHIVQRMEHFANGGSPDLMATPETVAEIQSNLTKIRGDTLYLRNKLGGLDDDKAAYETKQRYPDWTGLRPVSQDYAAMMGRGDITPQQVFERLNSGEEYVSNLLEQQKQRMGPTKVEAYFRIPGEAEARNIENRSYLTKPDLSRLFPLSGYDRPLEDILWGYKGNQGWKGFLYPDSSQ